MFRCKSLMKLMTQDKNGVSLDGLIRNVPNLETWKLIFENWPYFTDDVHNVKLGLALDGVNPFCVLNSCHSTWPMVLLNYNLPPQLVTKRYFIMLALIVPNKESCTSSNVDVYLQPFIEELQVQWKCVRAFNTYMAEKINLKAMCTWSIHDFLAYGLFAGCVTKRQVDFPPCGPHRYLPRNHQVIDELEWPSTKKQKIGLHLFE